MAIRDKEGRWSGKAGSWVFRRWRNLNVIQSVPRKVTQTPRSQAAAAEFGVASSTAGAIRKLLPVLYQHPDAGMAPRLVSSVLKSIRQATDKEVLERDLQDGDLSVLKDFQFNSHSPLNACLPKLPELQLSAAGTISVALPEYAYESIKCAISASKRSFFRIRLMAIAFNFREGYYDLLDWQDWHVYRDRSLDAQQWDIARKAPEGSVLMLAMAVYAGISHSAEDVILNQTEWSPAAILEARHIIPTVSVEKIINEETSEIELNHSSLSINIDWHRLRLLRARLLPALVSSQAPQMLTPASLDGALLRRGRGKLG